MIQLNDQVTKFISSKNAFLCTSPFFLPEFKKMIFSIHNKTLLGLQKFLVFDSITYKKTREILLNLEQYQDYIVFEGGKCICSCGSKENWGGNYFIFEMVMIHVFETPKKKLQMRVKKDKKFQIKIPQINSRFAHLNFPIFIKGFIESKSIFLLDSKNVWIINYKKKSGFKIQMKCKLPGIPLALRINETLPKFSLWQGTSFQNLQTKSHMSCFLLVTGTGKGKLCLCYHNPSNLKIKRTVLALKSGITSLLFNQENGKLFIGCLNGDIHRYEVLGVDKLRLEFLIEAHVRRVDSMKLLLSNRYLMSHCKPNQLFKIWRISSNYSYMDVYESVPYAHFYMCPIINPITNDIIPANFEEQAHHPKKMFHMSQPFLDEDEQFKNKVKNIRKMRVMLLKDSPLKQRDIVICF